MRARRAEWSERSASVRRQRRFVKRHHRKAFEISASLCAHRRASAQSVPARGVPGVARRLEQNVKRADAVRRSRQHDAMSGATPPDRTRRSEPPGAVRHWVLTQQAVPDRGHDRGGDPCGASTAVRPPGHTSDGQSRPGAPADTRRRFRASGGRGVQLAAAPRTQTPGAELFERPTSFVKTGLKETDLAGELQLNGVGHPPMLRPPTLLAAALARPRQIGRASCRERV